MRFRSLIAFFIGSLSLAFMLALALVLAPSSAHAQHWDTVRHPASGADVTPYFINIDTGFIYDAKDATLPRVDAFCFRTTNAGVDWYPVEAFNGHFYTIREIWFDTRDHGYLLADTSVGKSDPQKYGLLFETTNTGADWRHIVMDSLNVHSVYSSGNVIFVTATSHGFASTYRRRVGTFPFADSASIYRSTDAGATWQLVNAGPALKPGAYLGLTEITGNRDSLVVVTAVDASTQTYILYSEDLGNSWSYDSLEKQGSLYGYLQLQAYCLPYSCNVVRVLDDAQRASVDSFAFLEASPPFKYDSWKWLLDKETGGWFAGTECAQYLGSADYSDSGFFRLRNGNMTMIGGPDETEVDDDDFRNFCVLGHGAIVYAAAYGGSGIMIQRTTDGGDGTLSAAALAPQLSFDYQSLSGNSFADTLLVCDTGTIAIIGRNMSCSLARLDSASVTGLDPESYTVSIVRDARCRGVGDSVLIGIRRGFTSSGKVTVRSYFSDDELNPFDTSFTRVLVRKPSALAFRFAVPNDLSVRAGDKISIPVMVTLDPDEPVTIGGNTHIGLRSNYDHDLLTPIGFEPHIAGITPDAGTLTSSGLEYSLIAPNGFSIKSGDTIGAFRFVVRLAEATHSDFGFYVTAISSDDSHCLSATSNPAPLNIALSPQCGDETIRNFMMTGDLSLRIERIMPNPVADILHVQYQSYTQQPAEYRILDALGVVWQEGKLPSDASHIDLSVMNLPSGMYLLQCTAPNGAFVSKRIVVSR